MRVLGLGLVLAGCIFSIDESKLTATQDAGALGDSAVIPVDGESRAEAGATEPGLLGHWTFDNVTGKNVADVSGSGNAGTLEGSVTTIEGRNGGGAISTNDNSALGQGWFAVSKLDKGAFPRRGTLAMWLRAQRFVPESGGNAFFDEAPGAGKLGTWLVLSLAENLTVHLGFVAPSGNDEFSVPSTLGKWNHIVATWDGSRGTLYGGLEGEALQMKSEPYNPAFDPQQQAFVVMRRLFGDLDDLRLYNYALSEAEVRKLP